MEEIWKNCENLTIPNDDYAIVRIIYDEKGTKVKLLGDKFEIVLGFGYPETFKETRSSQRMVTFQEAHGIQNYRKTFVGNPLFKVENSNYMKWILEESAGFALGLEHYAIITQDEIFDIITSDIPQIESIVKTLI